MTLDTPSLRSGARYRSRSVEVEAIEWTGDNWDDVSVFVYGEVVTISAEEYDDAKWPVVVDDRALSVLEQGINEVHASPGDWIARHGDFFVVIKGDVFHAKFDTDGGVQ